MIASIILCLLDLLKLLYSLLIFLSISHENVSKIKKDEKEYFTIFLYSFNLFILENKLLNINIIKKLENLKEILDLDLEKEINIIKYKLYNLQNCCKYEICKFNDKFN